MAQLFYHPQSGRLQVLTEDGQFHVINNAIVTAVGHTTSQFETTTTMQVRVLGPPANPPALFEAEGEPDSSKWEAVADMVKMGMLTPEEAKKAFPAPTAMVKGVTQHLQQSSSKYDKPHLPMPKPVTVDLTEAPEPIAVITPIPGADFSELEAAMKEMETDMFQAAILPADVVMPPKPKPKLKTPPPGFFSSSSGATGVPLPRRGGRPKQKPKPAPKPKTSRFATLDWKDNDAEE